MILTPLSRSEFPVKRQAGHTLMILCHDRGAKRLPDSCSGQLEPAPLTTRSPYDIMGLQEMFWDPGWARRSSEEQRCPPEKTLK